MSSTFSMTSPVIITIISLAMIVANGKGKFIYTIKSSIKTFMKVLTLLVIKKDGYLKYDYHVKAGSDPDQIRIKYLGVSTPKIKKGELVIKHHIGQVIEERPYAYQYGNNGERISVECRYVLNEEGVLSYEFPNGYNKDSDLIIDPTLIFSTYSGSTADNFGMTATFDRQGAGYMGGVVFLGKVIKLRLGPMTIHLMEEM